MKTYILLIFAFLLLGFKIAGAEVLSGELENPGYDPLFWVSSTDCSVIEAEASKRYQSSNGLLKVEQAIVLDDLCHRAKACKLKWCSDLEPDLAKNKNSSLFSNESEDLIDNKTILSLEMKAKAELGKLLKERRALWIENIERIKKTEQSEKLSWQKLVMPFNNEDDYKPVINTKPNFINPNQQKPQSTDNAAQTNPAIKKDKYFNVLKK